MVPDPPGLFDGHVWPMYQKYKREMEQDGVEVGKPGSRPSLTPNLPGVRRVHGPALPATQP